MAGPSNPGNATGARWLPHHADYFINTQNIGSANQIPEGSVLSRAEYQRRGLTNERIGQLSNIMRSATTEEITERKRVIGISTESDADWLEKVGTLASNYAKLLADCNGVESKVAMLLEGTLRDWKLLENAYFEWGKLPISVNGNPPWRESVQRGFQLDRFREELSVTEMALRNILEPVKRAIVRLPAIDALPLQRFADTMHERGKDPNPLWRDASYNIELVRMKLEGVEAERKRHEPGGIGVGASSGYDKRPLIYIVNRTTLPYGIVRDHSPLLADTLLSVDEFQRRGLPLEYLNSFMQQDHMMEVASKEALANVKMIVGVTPEVEERRQAELDRQANEYEQEFGSANGMASEHAK
jgi:hypothetical protein